MALLIVTLLPSLPVISSPYPPRVMEWQESRHRMIQSSPLPAPTPVRLAAAGVVMMKPPGHSAVVSSQENSDLDPSLSHCCVLFFLGTPPPRTTPSEVPFTPSQNFPPSPSARVSQTRYSCKPHSPKSPSAESFHHPQPRPSPPPPRCQSSLELPASHPQSTPYMHGTPFRQSSHLVLRWTMQGRGRVPTFPPDLALPDGAAQADLPEMFSFLTCVSALLPVSNSPSCHWGMMEEGEGADGGCVVVSDGSGETYGSTCLDFVDSASSSSSGVSR
ncbi:hypothetical protein B0T18DRAFT_75521 [Schizothecium vesticola]|uniref:Uncharacterized protein n=1 Tax=Schizothecium vesticola TaxID=314040 RepID=A0AA40KA42_9PEZI|nr:hypothetical protein B0T18DRAFT_75521 [Schizothecium vesticola]